MTHTRTLSAMALACAMLAVGCASTGGVPRPFPTPGGWADPAPGTDRLPPAVTGAFDGESLVSEALTLRGIPYRNGGADPTGFDCSGFTQYVFARFGVTLPREARDQFGVGQRVRPSDLAAGDLVFFATTGRGVSHVAIVIGGDQFVHAPNSNGVVRVERLTSRYWSERFLGARRIAD